MIWAVDEKGGHPVGWDGEFVFDEKPSDPGVVPEHLKVEFSVVGAAYLSGRLYPVLVCYLDEDGVAINFSVDGPVVRECSAVGCFDFLVICGPGTRNHSLLRKACEGNPCTGVYVCPAVDELPCIGMLSCKIRNKTRRRDPLLSEFNDEINAEGIEFDIGAGDGVGRMAHLVQSGTPVLNQMMMGIGGPSYYGKVISCDQWWGEPDFLMRASVARRYFPLEPISLRDYASTSVPVQLNNNRNFARDSGYDSSVVSVMVASGHIPWFSQFLVFVHSMSSLEWVVSSDPKEVPVDGTIPVFRYDKGYNVDKKQYQRIL